MSVRYMQKVLGIDGIHDYVPPVEDSANTNTRPDTRPHPQGGGGGAPSKEEFQKDLELFIEITSKYPPGTFTL